MAKRKKGIYIFELKVDEPVDKAFAQIREKSEIPNRAVAVPATARFGISVFPKQLLQSRRPFARLGPANDMERDMEKFFNVAGPCFPAKHYMLPALDRMPEIRRLVEQEMYFVIHAPRQTGKTTALKALAHKSQIEIELCQRPPTLNSE